jgi:hypothetical protein
MVQRPETSRTAERAVLLVESLLNEMNWESLQHHTLRIPIVNRLTAAALLEILAAIKRDSFMEQAVAVIARFEEPSDCRDQHTWISSEQPFKNPLRPPDSSIGELALGRCILCESYFWMDESDAAGHERFRESLPPREPGTGACIPSRFAPHA